MGFILCLISSRIPTTADAVINVLTAKLPVVNGLPLRIQDNRLCPFFSTYLRAITIYFQYDNRFYLRKEFPWP